MSAPLESLSRAAVISLVAPEAEGGVADFAIVVIAKRDRGGLGLDLCAKGRDLLTDSELEMLAHITEAVARVVTAVAKTYAGKVNPASSRCCFPATSEGNVLCTLAFGHTGPHAFPPIGGES